MIQKGWKVVMSVTEGRSAKIITFSNQKGGVGKSTSAVNIAASAVILGKRVLIVDADPQGNTTSGFGISKKAIRCSIYDVLIHRSDISSAVLQTNYDNVWAIPANISLAGAEFELVMSEHRENRLKNALDNLRDQFDYIFIDCPPSLGILTINALVAADGFIIPMQCEYYALEGLSQLMLSVKQIKKHYNSRLNLTGILITMYNGRLNLSVQVLSELKKYYADKLFSTPIVRNVKLSEAPSFGMPIYYYDKHSKGAHLYMEVTKELFQRI